MTLFSVFYFPVKSRKRILVTHLLFFLTNRALSRPEYPMFSVFIVRGDFYSKHHYPFFSYNSYMEFPTYINLLLWNKSVFILQIWLFTVKCINGKGKMCILNKLFLIYTPGTIRYLIRTQYLKRTQLES